MTQTIGNPLSWSVDHIRAAGSHLESVAERLGGDDRKAPVPMPETRHIDVEDVRDALRKGIDDFAACRSDVAFLCIFYPIIGIALAWAAFNNSWLPLVFPMISGFALIGPVAGVGLYEMSRRRERGEETSWADAFKVAGSSAFGAIFVLGLVLAAIFFVWLLAANGIYSATLGPEPPASFGSFVHDVVTTPAGWAMVILGCAVGFLFASLVLVISVVSFPLLLERDVGLPMAVLTSIHVATTSPRAVGAWGLLVAVSLAVGAIPAFLGLIIALPILGHATWHLYRKAVVPLPEAAPQSPSGRLAEHGSAAG